MQFGKKDTFSDNLLGNVEEQHSHQIYLRRLLLIRSISICGQLLVIHIAYYFYQVSLPLATLLIIEMSLIGITLMAFWFNLLSVFALWVQLFIDIIALTALLYYSGGASNPFVSLYLLPVIMASIMLPARWAWLTSFMAVTGYSFVLLTYQAQNEHHHQSAFDLHVFGMWLGFLLSVLLISYFVVEIARNLRASERRLSLAREQTLRDQHLVALGTLSAGVAHELGTPLTTMAIIADEIQQTKISSDDGAFYQDINILTTQINRCKNTLATLRKSAGEFAVDAGHETTISDYFETVIKQWKKQRENTLLEVEITNNSQQNKILAEQTLTQSLISLLNNAADASPDQVIFKASWDEVMIFVDIIDFGSGIAQISSNNNGQFVSTKKHGMGLGLYLAHAVIERLNGEISLHNQQDFEGVIQGVCTHIELPIARLQVDGGVH
ncbi:MAG: hypothetical protein HON94_12165 [Methylococcales bacterium]|nr:hypothetical protein [Methylococcales bacterium]MBT7410942.1 hypothetical protein [Methylococcales bacterium]